MRHLKFLILPVIILFNSCTQPLRITNADVAWKYDIGMGASPFTLKNDTIIYCTVWDTVGYLSANGNIIRKVYDSIYRKKNGGSDYHDKSLWSDKLILNDSFYNGSVVTYLAEWDNYHYSLDLSNLIGVCSGGGFDEEMTSSVTLLKLKGGKKIKILWDTLGDIGFNYVGMRPYKDKLIIAYEIDEKRYIAMIDLHTMLKEHHVEYDWVKHDY